MGFLVRRSWVMRRVLGGTVVLGVGRELARRREVRFGLGLAVTVFGVPGLMILAALLLTPGLVLCFVVGLR